MPRKIVTVDDAATMRKMVALTIKELGHHVMEAADGVDALRLLQNQSVDLVITDVNMPRMDGIELTKKLRALPLHAKTPILILTTESDPNVKMRGKAAGATGWLVKPFTPAQLLTVVKKVVPA